MQQDKLPGVSIFLQYFMSLRAERRVYIGAGERFLRGLPISRAIAEESEIAQA